ncbi:hypothetical protein [Lacimicrobium sp. SS2-24]|uniref:hypothetical protein n=1 Tax=Lacimicrobium sp. SS2-24 TaxID=2005569 RepID=UPI00143C0EB8|nr:hypothetical protein [Lacimicrobium sp. SS2-24]
MRKISPRVYFLLLYNARPAQLHEPLWESGTIRMLEGAIHLILAALMLAQALQQVHK